MIGCRPPCLLGRPVSSSGRFAPSGRHRSPSANRTPVTVTPTACGVGHFQLPQVGHFRLPLTGVAVPIRPSPSLPAGINSDGSDPSRKVELEVELSGRGGNGTGYRSRGVALVTTLAPRSSASFRIPERNHRREKEMRRKVHGTPAWQRMELRACESVPSWTAFWIAARVTVRRGQRGGGRSESRTCRSGGPRRRRLGRHAGGGAGIEVWCSPVSWGKMIAATAESPASTRPRPRLAVPSGCWSASAIVAELWRSSVERKRRRHTSAPFP